MAKDVYAVELIGTVAGQHVANVLHMQGEEETGNPLDGAEALRVAFGVGAEPLAQTKYLDCLPDNYVLRGYAIRRVNNTGGPTVNQLVDNIAGNRAGSADFSGSGPVGLIHGPQVGDRFVTGKIFFPGASVDDVDSNTFSNALATECREFIDFLSAGIGAAPEGPFKLVVYNRTAGTAVEPLGNSVSLRVGQQRRRNVPLL